MVPSLQPKSTVDLTVIVSAHDETLVAGPTMESAELAARRAEEAGYTIERIIMLDKATDDTRAFFSHSDFDSWLHVESECGDIGLARNEAIKRARGNLIACLDGDDLFSENWLSNGIAECNARAEAGQCVIAHPELNWIFDNGNSIFTKIAQDDPLFTPLYFVAGNYYDSMLIAPRAVHLDCPYGPRDMKRGLAYQDWRFSIETMGRGFKHVIVPDTIIFKRRRASSLVKEAHDRNATIHGLDEMAIDRVRSLGQNKDSTS